MSIKTFMTTLISVLVISCGKKTQNNEAYKVLDIVFDEVLEKRDNQLKNLIEKYPENSKLRKQLDDSLYINPKFSYLLVSMNNNIALKSPDINHDLWVIDYMPIFNNCKNDFKIENLVLIGDSTYYTNQIIKAPKTLYVEKLKNTRIQYHKTELENYNNIKQFEFLKEKGIDSVTLQQKKESMLAYENKHFQISYPIFSKDKKYAIIYIEKIGLGMQVWILQKEKKKWEKVCVGHIGTIN